MADELFRNEERDKAEAAQMAAIRRHNQVNLKALLMTIAIAIAPFMALLISLNLALGVLAAGLLFSTVLTWWGANEAGSSQKAQLRITALLNLAVCLTVVLVLVLRLRG